MRYEEQVREICGDDWRTVNQNEKDGGYGVACLIAFIKGVRPTVADLAAHLGAKPDDVVAAFNRLHKNGVFSQNWKVKQDASLLGENGNDEDHRAWAHIAAIAGGFLGVPSAR